MKPLHDPWNRLAALLRQAPPEEMVPPYGFATRVVARWQAEAVAEAPWRWEMLLPRAAVCAGVATLAIVAAALWSAQDAGPDELAVVEIVMSDTWNP